MSIRFFALINTWVNSPLFFYLFFNFGELKQRNVMSGGRAVLWASLPWDGSPAAHPHPFSAFLKVTSLETAAVVWCGLH